MQHIIGVDELSHLSSPRKKIVLVGGCFDILHLGHIELLEGAKKEGEIVVVFLESDERVRDLKGKGRPVNSQQDRARLLLALKSVDYVVLLPFMKTPKQYDDLVKLLNPSVIATTKNDPGLVYKKRSAKLCSAKVKEVAELTPQKSSSKIIEILSKEV